jgi:hypothetical protein
MHPHALAAQTTQHATLQQGRSLPRRPRPPLAAEGTGVIGEPTLIDLEALPVDVALVHARHDELPFRSGNLDHGGAAVGQVACARAAIDEGASVARIMEHLQDACVRAAVVPTRGHPCWPPCAAGAGTGGLVP